MKTINSYVAVRPIKDKEPEKSTKIGTSRFDAASNLFNSLVSSEVVFDSEGFKAGDVLYFKADVRNHQAVRQVLSDQENGDFILLTSNLVIGYKGKSE